MSWRGEIEIFWGGSGDCRSLLHGQLRGCSGPHGSASLLDRQHILTDGTVKRKPFLCFLEVLFWT